MLIPNISELISGAKYIDKVIFENENDILKFLPECCAVSIVEVNYNATGVSIKCMDWGANYTTVNYTWDEFVNKLQEYDILGG